MTPKLNGLPITFHIGGYGARNILAVHGLLSSAQMYTPLVEQFAGEYRVHAVDLPGFGGNMLTNPYQEVTVQQHAETLIQACDAMAWRFDVAIGHSMGATVLLEAAARRPDLFGRLVLIAPVVTGSLFGSLLDGIIASRVGKTVLRLLRPLWPIVQRKAPTIAVQRGVPEAVGERMSRDFVQAQWGAFYGGLTTLVEINMKHVALYWKTPTLVIWGQDDKTVPPQDGLALCWLIAPYARSVSMRAVGHHPLDERPELVYAHMRMFLGLQVKV